VIGDAPLNQLTAEQANALRLWVGSGGLLIVTGGADVSGLKSSGLDSILPVDSLGAVTVNSLGELTTAYTPFESSDPLLVRLATTRSGSTTLLGQDQHAIVAERYYGAGLVRFLAISPKLKPYRGWGSTKDLWTDLLLPASETRPKNANWITMGQFGRSRSNRLGVQPFLFDLAEVKPTSPKYFLVILLLYILTVGPINYLVLRWMRKTELAWVTIPTVVIAFTVINVVVAQLSRGSDPVVADVSLVELHQRDRINRVTGGLLIMPTSKGEHELGFDGGSTYVSDMVSGPQTSNSALDNIRLERTSSQFTLKVPMNNWTAGIFQIRSTGQITGGLVSVSGQNGVEMGPTPTAAGSATVVISNQTESSISNAVYISRDGVSELFDLEPGAERRVTLSGAKPGAISAWYKSQLTSGSQEALVFGDLETVLDREIGGQPAFKQEFFNRASMSDALMSLERPLIIGFSEQSPTEIDFDRPLRRRSRTFYVIHL
jgi:hypothetical protein